MREVADRINDTFSKDFATIGVAGEVALVEPEDRDYEKYSLEIRVKFRANEALHVLRHDRQSGGERSVSTIAFLIALQVTIVFAIRVPGVTIALYLAMSLHATTGLPSLCLLA